MFFAIVIFPSKKLQDLANSYRKRYDPQYSLISPHIKLKAPFEVEATEENMKMIDQRLTEIAAQIKPFPMSVLKISSFKPVNNVIYFKIKPTEELIVLHKELHGSFVGEQPEYNFVPHVTIGQNLSDDEHSDVYGRLQMLRIQHEEIIDRFHLLYQLENESWTVHDTFQLGKE